ncbi:MAG: hypothetical protein SV201_14440 [Pseudomonadota bacterium]|nr:hypothetical protein [Pseudomonadota bacterium]
MAKPNNPANQNEQQATQAEVTSTGQGEDPTLEQREAELAKREAAVAAKEQELAKSGESKKAERGEEKPAWLVDPKYAGPLTGDQAEKRHAHFAELKAKENK